MAIHFFIEDVDNIKLSRNNTKIWIKNCINSFNKKVGEINYIFCSDEYLKNINIEYLKHNYYTDIITFNYSENNTLNSDIYISTETVLDNSVKFKVDFVIELRRVMIHGILHLVGLNDESVEQKEIMRATEDKMLLLYQ